MSTRQPAAVLRFYRFACEASMFAHLKTTAISTCLVIAAICAATASPALANEDAGPPAADAPCVPAAGATPTGAPTGDCDCGDGKACDPSKHHRKRPGMRHGPEHLPSARSTGMALSDMDTGSEDGEACASDDAMCQNLRDHGEAMPPWIRHVARRMMGPLQIDTRALVQTQFAALVGKDTSLEHGDRAERPGFALRRARFGASGRYGHRAQFGIFADLAGNAQSQAVLLSEAWASLSLWQNASITMGAHRTPYAKSAMISSARMALAERAQAIQAMAPFRQVGVTLSGSYPNLLGIQWHVGAYNGFERGKNFYAGMTEFNGLGGNRNGGIAIVGRLALAPLGDLGPEAYDAKGGGLRVEVGVNAYRSNGTTTTMAGRSADLHAKIKGVHLHVEMLADSGDPKDQPTEAATLAAKINRRAMLVEAGYSMWRFNGALRAQLIDTNADNDTDPEEQIFSGAVGYQLPGDRVRLQLQVDHRQEVKGAALSNDVAFLQMQLLL